MDGEKVQVTDGRQYGSGKWMSRLGRNLRARSTQATRMQRADTRFTRPESNDGAA